MGEIVRANINLTPAQRAEKGLLSDEQLETLADANGGRVAHVIGPKGRWEIVFRAPTRPEYRLFQADVMNPMTKVGAQERLIERLAVHPTGKALTDMLDRYVAIPDACSDEFGVLSGQTKDELGK